jgi:hypothetical protein
MIILGDNPFFGVNHASTDRSKGYFARLKARDWSSAHVTMRAAMAKGVDHFMVSTHAEAPELLASMRQDPDLRCFSIIPAVPYLYRLNGLVAAKGVPAAVLQSMSYPTFFKGALTSGSIPASALAGFISKEVDEIAGMGFDVPAIALQNIFVDLLLGLGQADFISEVGRRMAAEGRRLVAITMNPILADRLLAPEIILCTHYNVLGYMVQPDLKTVRDWLDTTSRKVWAMGVMSSGKAKLADVVSDRSLHRFESVVLGASRPASIEAFVDGYAAQH